MLALPDLSLLTFASALVRALSCSGLVDLANMAIVCQPTVETEFGSLEPCFRVHVSEKRWFSAFRSTAQNSSNATWSSATLHSLHVPFMTAL